ncbi:hypothetical protein [Herbaspirillum sp. NPDC101396]|uniref:capsular polysaccharide export protein, LipB/KpsS family n=1 Tax=Herbaspirillum sp. NPDC101396 TaxID=3364005 RepID=UPI00383A9D82
MKRVFYIECSGPIWRDVAAHCRDDAQWQPVLWTAAHGDAAEVAQQFPESLFISGTDAALGITPSFPSWDLPALDAPLLEALATDESIVLHMMDRMDPAGGAGFPHDARRRHYHRLLSYWLGALDALRPDLIVFSIAPHIIFDYVILALARHRRIPTVMFERIGLPGWVYPMSDFKTGAQALRDNLSDAAFLESFVLPDAFQDWITKSLQGHAAVPANYQKKLLRYKLGNSQQTAPLFRAVLHELKRAVVLFRKNGTKPAVNSYLRSQNYPHGRCGPLETLMSRLRGLQKKRKLMRYHDAISCTPDAQDNYILLGLHYQPERATVPMGGAFGDQTLIVKLLSSALPAGWKLYVKEHPWQLQSFGRGEVQRSEDFYAFISSLPNVKIIRRETSTATMVRNARAVATVTGSVGWDALCSGVPVLLFGAAWYRDCIGVHSIYAKEELAAALKHVVGGNIPRAEDAKKFCKALAGVCIPGTLEPELEQIGALTHKEAAERMSSALVQFVKKAELQ